MALQSFKITRKEIQTYYSPRVSRYQRIINSINSPMGYGQYIEKYVGSDVINTYYHVWDNSLNAEIVLDGTTFSYYPIAQAGPNLWNVSSQTGISFLNGTTSINGFRKLKYCNGCGNNNTPIYNAIDTFKKSFSQVEALLSNYNTLDGYLFIDQSLPRFTNIFPAIKYDDGINVNFYFKNLNGTDKTISDISRDTGKTTIEIETSIDTAEIVKPQDGVNSLIMSCCDERTYYVAEGQLGIGKTVTTENLPESVCWYVESYTNDGATVPRGTTFSYGERSCASCITNNPCGGGVSCNSEQFMYGGDISSACAGRYSFYDFDTTNQIIYDSGQCGNQVAAEGYYLYYGDNMVYYFDGRTLNIVGPCKKK